MGQVKTRNATAKRKKEFPGASHYPDRHGNRRWRYRKSGFSAELGTQYGSPDFVRRYEAALLKLKGKSPRSQNKYPKGSFGAVLDSWYESFDFVSLKESTKSVYRRSVEPLRDEYGRLPVSEMKVRHVKKILAAKAKSPHAASNLRKRLIQILDHSIELNLREDNPARSVKSKKVSTTGFHTWSESEITAFFGHHKPGTVPHSAVTLMLYTGAARIDAVNLGPNNIIDGRLVYFREKTAGEGGVEVNIPVHPDLAAVLDTLPRDRVFLATRKGSVRSEKSFGNMMRKWCNEVGLPQCSAHGLRKACARRLAEAGASANEIMAVTGHKTLSLVQLYTEKAERKGMADSAVDKLTPSNNETLDLANQ